jgi:hypothetical protein
LNQSVKTLLRLATAAPYGVFYRQGDEPRPIDGCGLRRRKSCREARTSWSAVSKAGVDLVKLAADLQTEGAKSFDDSWNDLLQSIDRKSHALS